MATDLPTQRDGEAQTSPGRMSPVRLALVSIISVVATVALIVAVTNRPSSSARVATKPTPAPNFTLALVNDPHKTFELTTLRGTPVVLNFWQSSCIPCQTEMPMLQRLSVAAKGKVAVVGVDITDAPSSAKAFLAEHPLTYTLVADPSATLSGPYGVAATPQTFVISPDGEIVAHFLGPVSSSALRTAITSNLGVKVP